MGSSQFESIPPPIMTRNAYDQHQHQPQSNSGVNEIIDITGDKVQTNTENKHGTASSPDSYKQELISPATTAHWMQSGLKSNVNTNHIKSDAISQRASNDINTPMKTTATANTNINTNVTTDSKDKLQDNLEININPINTPIPILGAQSMPPMQPMPPIRCLGAPDALYTMDKNYNVANTLNPVQRLPTPGPSSRITSAVSNEINSNINENDREYMCNRNTFASDELFSYDRRFAYYQDEKVRGTNSYSSPDAMYLFSNTNNGDDTTLSVHHDQRLPSLEHDTSRMSGSILSANSNQNSNSSNNDDNSNQSVSASNITNQNINTTSVDQIEFEHPVASKDNDNDHNNFDVVEPPAKKRLKLSSVRDDNANNRYPNRFNTNANNSDGDVGINQLQTDNDDTSSLPGFPFGDHLMGVPMMSDMKNSMTSGMGMKLSDFSDDFDGEFGTYNGGYFNGYFGNSNGLFNSDAANLNNGNDSDAYVGQKEGSPDFQATFMM